MGTKDIVTAKYISQNEVFADAFNFLIYDGEPVIRPESLVELDTREIGVPYGGDGAKQPVQRTRDVIKAVTAMTDNHAAYLVLAVENQSNVHYAMPVKNLVYDALQYAKQVELASQSHSGAGDHMSGGEFLSNFNKKDRLMPVVTLVIYFGEKEWDGPMSLHEMFQERDPRILPFVPDYRINLISPAAIADADFEKFSSTLKVVLGFIKYSRNREKLTKLINSEERFKRLGRSEVEVINAFTRADIQMRDTEEVVDMCEAIKEMIAEGRAEGREEGRAEGRAEERAERIGALVNVAEGLAKKLGMPIAEAIALMDISQEDRTIISQRLSLKQ